MSSRRKIGNFLVSLALNMFGSFAVAEINDDIFHLDTHLKSFEISGNPKSVKDMEE